MPTKSEVRRMILELSSYSLFSAYALASSYIEFRFGAHN
jgi:hypothetical protein